MKPLNLRTAAILAGLVLGLGATAPASATLLNVPITFPLLSYDNGGTTTYDAATDAFHVDAFPIAIRLNAADSPHFITPNPPVAGEYFKISILVDDSGHLIGDDGANGLNIFGFVDLDGDHVFDAAGTLLTGTVTGFGFQNGGATDLYDFTFNVTGGALASYFADSVGVSLQSEKSSFVDSFKANFAGGAKGTLGNVPEPASLLLLGAGVLGLSAIGRKRG